MIFTFNPRAWFWVIGGDTSRAWSSAASAYVATWDHARSTKIASEGELSDVLRSYGLIGPAVTSDDVRNEASQRMQNVFGARGAAHLEIIIANASREAIRLLRVKADRAWTEAEAARAAELEAADYLVEVIRAASNAMESNPPADYREDKHWPSIPGA